MVRLSVNLRTDSANSYPNEVCEVSGTDIVDGIAHSVRFMFHHPERTVEMSLEDLETVLYLFRKRNL